LGWHSLLSRAMKTHTLRRLAIAALAPCLLLISTEAQDLASQNAKVDALFSRFNSTTPGCALGVVSDGKLVYSRGYGMASLELSVPITPHTVFDIGSDSKQITAAAIVLLEQQGKLSLDDDVRKFVPELPDYGHAITLRHLLHHTSGLRDYISLLRLAGAQEESVTTADDALAILARQRGVNFAPGENFLYSNSGYFLLSLVAKKASGQSLSEFAQQNIFAPLGMKDTFILDDHTRVIRGKAASYAPTGAGRFRNVTSNWEQTGDGAVQTTVEDLAKWDANFYDAKVGGKALLHELESVGTLNDGSKLTYAPGLVVDDYRGLRRVAHGGSWAGFRTAIIRFPNQQLSIILPCNVANAEVSDLAQAVANLYLQSRYASELKTATGKPTSGAEKVAGTYFSPEALTVRRFVAKDGKLYAADALTTELLPMGGSQYLAAGDTKIRFENDRVVLIAGSGHRDWFERVTEEKPSAADLAPLVGEYWSDELALAVRLAVGQGKLIWHAPENALRLSFRDVELTPVTASIFSGGGMVLQFDAAGVDKGFSLGAGRSSGMRFTRQRGTGSTATN
jgi:CubicO group peptidase (beta-lactamase class C family)